MLNQDYDTASRSGIGGLITSLERWRGGNLIIDGQDFEGFGQGSRFYPLLYISCFRVSRGGMVRLITGSCGRPGAGWARQMRLR